MKLTFSRIKDWRVVRLAILSLAICYTIAIIKILPSAFAQDGESAGISISPAIFELNADPGDTVSNQVKIYNPTEYPQTVKMLMEDFTPVGEEGEVTLDDPDENSTYSIASWTEVSPTEFTLQSKQQQLVTYTINIPTNGEPGGHYGSLVAFISGGTQNVSGSSVGSKRGALILLRVSGAIDENVIIDTFNTSNFQEYGPIEFSLKFKNNGNVHVRPAGFITVTDTFGKKVAELEIPQNNVIPDAIRKADTTWDEENLIGRFTATVFANYGTTEKQTVTQVLTFTVFPWKKAIIIGAIVAFMLFILFKSRKRISLAVKVLLGKSK